jgi:hypothetical protein
MPFVMHGGRVSEWDWMRDEEDSWRVVRGVVGRVRVGHVWRELLLQRSSGVYQLFRTLLLRHVLFTL